MDNHQPRIKAEQTSAGACAVLLGDWTAAQLTERGTWSQVQKALKSPGNGAWTSWQLAPEVQLDHLGAQALWNAWGRRWPEQLHASADQRAIVERVAKYGATPPAPVRPSLAKRFDNIGVRVTGAFAQVRDFTRVVGQVLIDFLYLLKSPRMGPWRDFSSHLYNVGGTALPITALVGFLIGVVLAYLMSQVLRQFGAEVFIVNILGLALVRELGPILAAVLIAGRSGSAITAQIGVMRVTEELDAMRVMGIPVSYRLVLPRAMALGVAMPLVSVWTTLAALAGGMLAAFVALDITPAYFLSAMPKAVSLPNLILAVSKSIVFGVSIALIASHYGLRVQPNTESLGRGTTASVVASITVVILIDALFAILFKSVGV